MRILIDLQHPAHLHFFRNAAARLVAEGHQVLFTGRDKDILRELAGQYDVAVTFFGTAKPGLASLGMELLYRQGKLWRIMNRFQPDAMMAIAGTFIGTLGWIRRVPTYVFYDTEHATLSNLLAYPFASCVYVPRCYYKEIPWRHERYNGYHELAYLRPEVFTPDPGIRAEAGLGDDPFVLVRFVAWGALHDMGKQGLSLEDKRMVVERLSRHRRVLISAEGPLPEDLEPMRVQVPVHRIHDLLAAADLVFGESGTMPSEAAMLGVPSVYVNPLKMGYLNELESDYGIVSVYDPGEIKAAVARAEALLAKFDRPAWKATGQRILEEKIDVTDMICRIATTRPHSRYFKETG